MKWRSLHEEDLSDCLDIAGPRAGFDLVGPKRGTEIWKDLLRSSAFNAAVIETQTPIAGHRIVGFGSSVFVSPCFADHELSMPRPGLNSRILQSIERSQSVVLSSIELRHSNTYSLLDLVVLCGCWIPSSLPREKVTQVQALLAMSFLEHHLGYRLRMLISEAVGEADRQFAEDSRSWKTICEFEANSQSSLPDGCKIKRSLVAISRSDALEMPGTVASILFHCFAPTLGLSSADKRLLIAAIRGLTDIELSSELQISVPAVKKRWLAIFERVRMNCPDILVEIYDEPDSETRGKQKRHRVLDYVRRHPEELRPTEDLAKGRS